MDRVAVPGLDCHFCECGCDRIVCNSCGSELGRLSRDAHKALSDEYKRWLDFYHAGEGDFDDFLRREIPNG